MLDYQMKRTMGKVHRHRLFNIRHKLTDSVTLIFSHWIGGNRKRYTIDERRYKSLERELSIAICRPPDR